jgi:hypothetical protein
MKYLIKVSDETNEEKVFCENESEATAMIEQKVRDGISEESISIFLLQPVSFQVERVPVAKISETAVDRAISNPVSVAQSDEPEVPDFRARATDSSATGIGTSNPFLSEQVFSLDS